MCVKYRITREISPTIDIESVYSDLGHHCPVTFDTCAMLQTPFAVISLLILLN